MIKIYGMPTCPDCAWLEPQIKDSPDYIEINIAEKPANLKEFLKIRDSSPAFDSIRNSGTIGIPCFVLKDGTVTLTPEDAGLKSRPQETAADCRLDGTGC